MTTKEKAQELYCKYADALNIRDLQLRANPYAKQCALIAVAFAKENPLNTNGYNKYLDEVKSEIEAL
jgi:hypothetical protein